MRHLLLAVLLVLPVLCQTEPRVRLRSRVSPEGTVMVGQPARFTVDVLVTTWLTGAPEYPQLELPGAIVVLPEERPLNLNEDFDGERWFGLSRSYFIYPQEPGEYVTPPAEVVVKYGGGSRSPARMVIPEQRFSATVPAEAAGLGYFIPTKSFRIEQQVEPDPAGLKVGDAVRRTVTMSPDGAFAMFLPPLRFESAPGLAVYPDPPKVEDLGGDRSGFQGGRRIESASYVIQKDGEYTLPAINIAWWDLSAGRLREASVAAVKFSAAPNPDYRPGIDIPAEATVAEEAPAPFRWREFVERAVLALVVVLGAGALFVWLPRRVVPYLRRRREERRRRYAESEAAAYARLRAALRNGDPSEIECSLYHWLDRLAPGPPPATLRRIDGGEEVRRELERRQAACYGRDATGDRAAFVAHLPELFGRLRRSRIAREPARTGQETLPRLNPAAQPVRHSV